MRLRACINYNKSSESAKHVLLQVENKVKLTTSRRIQPLTEFFLLIFIAASFS